MGWKNWGGHRGSLGLGFLLPGEKAEVWRGRDSMVYKVVKSLKKSIWVHGKSRGF